MVQGVFLLLQVVKASWVILICDRVWAPLVQAEVIKGRASRWRELGGMEGDAGRAARGVAEEEKWGRTQPC